MEWIEFKKEQPTKYGKYVIIHQSELMTANWMVTVKEVVKDDLPDSYISALKVLPWCFISNDKVIIPDYWAHVSGDIKEYLDKSSLHWVVSGVLDSKIFN